MSKAPKRRVRPLALCLLQQDEHLFVAEGYDAQKQQTFYRPLGGGIEFGEAAAATIVRELHEEIGAAVINLRYLGTLENIFTYNGEPGHEIVLLYRGEFADPARRDLGYVVQGVDDVQGTGAILFSARWLPLAFFRAGGAPLYPDGLLALLDAGAD